MSTSPSPFKKIAKTSTEPQKHGAHLYEVFSLVSCRVEPFERKFIRTGIALDLDSEHVAEVFQKEHSFVRNGLFVIPKLIDGGNEDEIVLEVINLSLPDFLLTRDRKTLTSAAFFGSFNSVSLSRGDSIACVLIRKIKN